MCALYALAGAIASFGTPTKCPIAYADHQRLIYDALREHLLSAGFKSLRQKIAADSAMQGAALGQFISLDYLQFDALALLFKEVGRVYKVPTNIVLLICGTDGAITGASSEGDLEVSSNVAFLLLTSSGDAGHCEYMAPVLDPDDLTPAVARIHSHDAGAVHERGRRGQVQHGHLSSHCA
jgi:hypothetical protein